MRIAALVLLGAAALTGCGKPVPPAGSAGIAASAPAGDVAPVEGAPHIVTTPDFVHIEYHVYGHGDPVIVLVHGWSCNSNYWNSQLGDLKSRYTVVTLDLAGHGASGSNRTDWSMAAFGADVAAVANEFRNRPIVLVGHSMGGPVVVEAARLIGDRVIGVIGVDTLKSIGLPPPKRADVEASVAPFRKDFIGETRRLIGSPAFFTKDADPVFERKIADDMAHARPEVAIPSIVALQSWDPRPASAALKVPLIVINSDLGGVSDEASNRKVAPTYRLVTVPGTGHFLMMEVPGRFNPILDHEIDVLTQTRKMSVGAVTDR